MPFMYGVHPIRRTLQYLNNPRLVLKPFVRIFAVHYNKTGQASEGTKEFVHWHVCQLQYKNPEVQVVTFTNLTPTPFIRVFFDSGNDVLMDVFNQSKDEIKDRVIRTLCQTPEEIAAAAEVSDVQEKVNPANFGYGCKRHCICEIPGQVPCSALVPLPYHMRGKYRMGFAELDDSKYL